MNPSTKTTTLAALAGLALAASSLQAAVILADDFSGDGLSALNGTTPDTTTGVNWVAGAAFLNDGSAGPFGGSGSKVGSSATLAYTPLVGNIYNLDARIDFQDGVASWLGLGFADGQSSSSSSNSRFVNNSTPLGRAWLLIDSTGVDGGMFQNGTSASYDVTRDGALASTGLMDVRLVLDTTAATWTVTYLAKKDTDSSYTLLKDAVDVITPAGFTSVGFVGNEVAAGTIESFSLSIVPEPSTTALLGLGGLALMLRRRR